MKLYVQAVSSYNPSLEDISLKKELKQNYKVDSRRKDDFILSGLLGALRLQKQIDIKESDELYLTSGFGNINILMKTNDYILEKKEYMKLFDFLNMLGNTTSYYVATELGIKAKSIFQISDNFTFFNSLIMLYASLSKSKNEALLGSIDILSNDEEVLKRVSGLEESVKVISSVNYQKLSLNDTNAICELEFDTKFYSYEEIVQKLQMETSKVTTSLRCKNLQYETVSMYHETVASYIVNDAIAKKEDRIFVECYDDKYKILKITIL